MRSTKDITRAVEALSQRELSTLEEGLMGIPYLDKLNMGQQIAATRREGNYLVIAGPGTGKTHTLTYRVLHMIKTGIEPGSIVVITFTRKSGNELIYRINELLPNTSLGFVGTFHGFANHISQIAGKESPISKFRLLDASDDLQVHNHVLADTNHFDQPIRAGRLQKVISYCSNTGMTPDAYISKFKVRNMEGLGPAIEAYRLDYDRYKAEHLLASYDDMILKISHYLEEAKNLDLPYDYLMIDEYQDTNRMQLDFIKGLKIPNVMAIGDDFQGIYAFRGADHRIILNFYNDFEKASMIKLTDNYRSTAAVVDWVNQTVEGSWLGYHKTLISARESPGSVTLMPGGPSKANIDFVIEKVKGDTAVTHAVIYRYNKQRTAFEKAMMDAGIDYAIYGGVRLLERKHIKDVLAFLMVYLNRRDVISYSRLLTIYPGIGPKTARRLIKSDLLTEGLGQEKAAFIDDVRKILTYQGTKEGLYNCVCQLYKKVYERIGSDYYSWTEIKEDFDMVESILKGYTSLENFIMQMILDPVKDLKKGQHPKVVLTTIHSAKGLEFDQVYYFHTHNWYNNYDLFRTEEDRRLFYVGISRAKSQLYVFDYTDTERGFDVLLKDFAKVEMAKAPDKEVIIEDQEQKVIKVDFTKRRKKQD